MSKEKVEKLIQVIEENREEIENLGLKIFKDRYSYGGLSGWTLGVQAHIDGSVYEFGPVSQGTQTMASFKGDAVTVVRFGTENYEFGVPLENYEIEDINEFRQWIREEHSIDREDYENDNEYLEAIDEYVNMYEYSQFNEAQYDKWFEEDFDWYISEFGADAVTEKIDQTLENLKMELENL